MPERNCRRWTTERRVATVGQNCVWFRGFLSETLGLSRRLGAPTRAFVPVEPGARFWIGVRAGRQRTGPLASLYILSILYSISHILYCILYLYFLSQRAQPFVPTFVERRVGKLTYVRPLWASLYILFISCSIVT